MKIKVKFKFSTKVLKSTETRQFLISAKIFFEGLPLNLKQNSFGRKYFRQDIPKARKIKEEAVAELTKELIF